MIINATPHKIDIFAATAPEIIETTPAGIPAHRPILIIPASGTVARLEERVVDDGRRLKGAEAMPSGITIVNYGVVTGLPDVRAFTWVVVSLACALALPDRPDLLVPWRQVRNKQGTIIGCRGLARAH